MSTTDTIDQPHHVVRCQFYQQTHIFARVSIQQTLVYKVSSNHHVNLCEELCHVLHSLPDSSTPTNVFSCLNLTIVKFAFSLKWIKK